MTQRLRARVHQIFTDETRVRQILTNGLTNAIKYANAPETGPIRVAVGVVEAPGRGFASPRLSRGSGSGAGAATTGGAAPRWLCFEVIDQGPGLRGLSEAVMLVDFLAPVRGAAPETGDARAAIRIGSSGVGLPVCAR